jgi:imidazolonepropionase-like amidohydrolase
VSAPNALRFFLQWAPRRLRRENVAVAAGRFECRHLALWYTPHQVRVARVEMREAKWYISCVPNRMAEGLDIRWRSRSIRPRRSSPTQKTALNRVVDEEATIREIDMFTRSGLDAKCESIPRWHRRMLFHGLLPLAFFGFLGAVPASGADAGLHTNTGLYLKGAAIFPSGASEPVRGHAVIVRGQRIEGIVPSDAPVPSDLTIIDLRGKTLLPGLIDSHVHLTVQEKDFRAAFKKFLDAGVTSVKDLGGDPRVLGELRRKVDLGEMEGPRIFFAGPLFTSRSGHPVINLWCGHQSADFIAAASRQPGTRDDASAMAHEIARSGVDLLKVIVEDCNGRSFPCGGVTIKCEKLRSQEVEAIVMEAHAAGLRVVAHAQRVDLIQDAINAGVDGIEHGEVEHSIATDPRHIAPSLVEKGIFLDSTFTRSSKCSTQPCDLPSIILENVRQLIQAGVKFTVGTDAVIDWGILPSEIEMLVRAGMSPADALRAATSNAAENLGRSDLVGTIDVGKRADLIAVDGDPLRRISDIRNISLVIRDGVVVRRRP